MKDQGQERKVYVWDSGRAIRQIPDEPASFAQNEWLSGAVESTASVSREALVCLVAVVVRLVRSFDGHVYVFSLFGCELL